MKKIIFRILLILIIAAAVITGVMKLSGFVVVNSSGIHITAGSVFPKPGDKSGTIKVACVGDSITYGDTLSDPETEAYPARLKEKLGSPYNVTNYGYGGTGVQKNARSSYWNNEEYKLSRDADPDAVIIMLGTNDTWEFNWTDADTVLADYAEFVESYASLSSHPDIILMTEPKMFGNYGDFNRRLMKINAGVRKYANNNGYQLIDLYKATKKHPEYFTYDGVHPDADGAEYIASYIYDKLMK